MPSRLNHVKIVTPHPEIVDAFLTQVCDIPEGWAIGSGANKLATDAPLGPGGDLERTAITDWRGSSDPGEGFISGNPTSRQFQIFTAEQADVWAVCVSTRYVEDVYQRAKARGVPCTPITVADWSERDNIRNFFCIVDGLMFEVIRVEPKQPG